MGQAEIIDLLIGKVLTVSIAIAVLFLSYRIFIRNNNRFSTMRLYLISSLIFAFVLPFMKIHVPAQPIMLTENLMQYFNELDITITNVETQTATEVDFWDTLLFVYWGGVFAASLILLIKIVNIFLIILKSKKNKNGKYTIIYTSDKYNSFSFLNYIFVPEGDVNDKIMSHEKSHINHHHTFDILLVEIMKIMQWFNPFIYMYKNELQMLHEFTADNDVISQGATKSDYMMLIMQQCTAASVSSIGNNFSIKLTKKRFEMISKDEKSKGIVWKVIATLPMAAMLLLINCQAIAQATNENTNGKNELDATATVGDVSVDEFGAYIIANVMPTFPGGEDALREYIERNVKYPTGAQCKETVRLYVYFTVDADGSIKNIKVRGRSIVNVELEKKHYRYIRQKFTESTFDDEAIRVVSQMPKWEPGEIDGKKVPVGYVIPIMFSPEK